MFDASSIFALGALLFLKHFLADGPLQTTWQVRNKGRFGHPAGLTHAGIHVAGSALAFVLWPFVAGVDPAHLEAHAGVLGAILLAEFVVHYIVDLTKCSLDRAFHCSEVQIDADGKKTILIHKTLYFHLFLADQTCHSLTYVAMMYAVSVGLAA